MKLNSVFAAVGATLMFVSGAAGAQDTGSAFYEYTFLRDLPQSDSGEEAE